jgi:hypothetical protein
MCDMCHVLVLSLQFDSFALLLYDMSSVRGLTHDGKYQGVEKIIYTRPKVKIYI